RARPAESGAGDVPAACASLADPAWPLCLQGAAARMFPLHRRRSLQLPAEDKGAGLKEPGQRRSAALRVMFDTNAYDAILTAGDEERIAATIAAGAIALVTTPVQEDEIRQIDRKSVV